MKIISRNKQKSKVRTTKRKLPSQRSTAYSYYRSDNGLSTSKESRQTPQNNVSTIRRIVTRLAGIVGILFIIVIAVYFTTLTSNSNISFRSETESVRSKDQYQQAITEFIDSSILNKSKLTLDVSGLSSHLTSQFAEIKNIDISIPVLSRNIDVKFDLYKPVFLVESEGKTVVASQNGVVLSDSYIEASNLILINDTSGINPEDGKPVFPAQTGTFLATVVEQLREKNIGVSSVELSSNPFDVLLALEDYKYKIKSNVLENPLEQSGAVIAFINERESRGLGQPKEYVDVRVPERIFFK